MSDSRAETPTADANVRIAWAADADGIAGVQVRALRRSYEGILPAELLAALDAGPDQQETIAQHWRESLAKPPSGRHRVLVGLEAGAVVGFAATAPSDDEDADPVADAAIAAFHIDPDAIGRGNGSRLLNACVDTLRADGFGRATIWLFGSDDSMRSFLTGAGWAADGAHRELDLHGDGTVRAKQIRLHCSLAED